LVGLLKGVGRARDAKTVGRAYPLDGRGWRRDDESRTFDVDVEVDEMGSGAGERRRK
jgi:hypothetical protein